MSELSDKEKYPIAMNDEQYKKVIELAQKDIKEELDRQINVRMINEDYIEKNYISKDKIKAKIEEYKKQIDKMEREDDGIGFTLGQEWSDLKAKVEFGQSLLYKSIDEI